MQRFIFVFFFLLVSTFARRSAPQTPPRAYLPKGYPYGWGMPIPEHPEVKKEKEVKEVKRSKSFFRSVNRLTNLVQLHSRSISLPSCTVVKKPKEDPAKEALRALRMAALEDMIEGIE